MAFTKKIVGFLSLPVVVAIATMTILCGCRYFGPKNVILTGWPAHACVSRGALPTVNRQSKIVDPQNFFPCRRRRNIIGADLRRVHYEGADSFITVGDFAGAVLADCTADFDFLAGHLAAVHPV